MALIKCRECGNDVSTKAEACPKCGAKRPRQTSLLTKLVGGFLAIGVIGAVFGHHDGGGSGAAAPVATASPAPNAAPAGSAPGADDGTRRKAAARSSKTLASLRKKTDKIEGIDWYFDTSSPSSLAANNVQVYLGMRPGGTPWLRLKMQYTDSDWLFIQDAIVVVDGRKFATVSGSWERDNDSTVYEWLDIPVESDNLPTVRAMAGAKEVTIRYEGRQYHRDRKLSPRELQAMRHVLSAYTEQGGA